MLEKLCSVAEVITILAAVAAVVPAGASFRCTPTRVWDGDGPLWCAEGPRIRLSGIAAREMNGTCRSNQPCPSASAEAARDALVRLIGTPVGKSREGHVLVKGPPLTCRSIGSGKGNRTAAWCTSPRAGDLSCAMVTTRTVLKWERYWRGHQCSESR
jgi:endonuclease YncB( thermonuclease family)